MNSTFTTTQDNFEKKAKIKQQSNIKMTNIPPAITIVIGTLDRPKVAIHLLNCLEIISTHLNMEVIVTDQSSNVNYEILKNYFPKKDGFVLKHQDQPNTCRYLNTGWKSARAPIVLYIDDDVVLTEQTIRAHIDAYNNSAIMGVAGRVINNNEKQITSNVVGKTLWYGALFKKNFSSKNSCYVDFPYGCNMSFRKEALKEIEGFDERLQPPIFAYNEIDVGYRINKRWKNSLIFEPRALVHHLQTKSGGTRNNFEQKKVFETTQFNYGYFLGKNFTVVENILCILRRLPYQIMHEIRAIPSIFNGIMYAKHKKIK